VGTTKTGQGHYLLSLLSTRTLRNGLPTPTSRPSIQPGGSIDEQRPVGKPHYTGSIRTEQWADQDRVRQQAQNWVEEANAQNDAERRTQEAQRAATGKAVLVETEGPSGSGTEPDISDLAEI
jgi:hypothetical protein